ncbi:MAG: hypothetical protein SGCHY_004619, partial [Lobulomycetales sp.]
MPDDPVTAKVLVDTAQWSVDAPHHPHSEQHKFVSAQIPLPRVPLPQVPVDTASPVDTSVTGELVDSEVTAVSEDAAQWSVDEPHHPHSEQHKFVSAQIPLPRVPPPQVPEGAVLPVATSITGELVESEVTEVSEDAAQWSVDEPHHPHSEQHKPASAQIPSPRLPPPQ